MNNKKTTVLLALIAVIGTMQANAMFRYSRVNSGLLKTHIPQRQFSSWFDSLKKPVIHDQKKEAPIKKHLANGMDLFVMGTLAALKQSQTDAKTPAQKYITDIAALAISHQCTCRLLLDNFHNIEAKTKQPLPHQFPILLKPMDRCESLVQHNAPKNLKDITEQLTNCSTCMQKFLDQFEGLKKSEVLSRANYLEEVIKTLPSYSSNGDLD